MLSVLLLAAVISLSLLFSDTSIQSSMLPNPLPPSFLDTYLLLLLLLSVFFTSALADGFSLESG